jgi:alanine racemase
MSRPTILRIDCSALTHNLLTAQQQFPECFTWAVVKANAYGHGLTTILPAFEKAAGFALLEFDAAIPLRQYTPNKPILILEGPFSKQDAQLCIEHQFTPVIHHIDQIEWFDSLFKQHVYSPLSIYVKLNTGMNRLGFSPTVIHSILEKLTYSPWVKHVTLMTHFANADTENGITQALDTFNQVQWQGDCSLANSAALFGWSVLHQQPGSPGHSVRPGISLYGSSPLGHITAKQLNLQATMSFEAGIIAIQNLKTGDTVGYGSTFTALHPMRIGVVACGYADGYPRQIVSGAPVWVEGQHTQLVGRISMDMLTIDLTDCPQANIGSIVELWGKHIPIDLVAKHAGTISYELMCGITSRVTRIYH